MKIVRLIAVITLVLLTVTACGQKTESNLPKNTKIKTEVNASSSQTDSSVKITTDSTLSPAEDKGENKSATSSTVNSKQPASQKPQQTTVTPKTTAPQKTPVIANGKVVVIDPGHANRSNLQTEPIAPGSSVMKIKDGGGTQGVDTRTPEYLVNMEVAKKLKTLLEQKGFTVVMTKTDNSVSLGNVERAEIWNRANAGLVIRIHADGSDNSAISGASMLTPQAINENTRAIYDESKRCGQIVLSTLVRQVGMNNRGLVTRSDMTGFNWSKVPVILVELGFLSNHNEDNLLSSSAYQDKLAKGLADGISEALK